MSATAPTTKASPGLAVEGKAEHASGNLKQSGEMVNDAVKAAVFQD